MWRASRDVDDELPVFCRGVREAGVRRALVTGAGDRGSTNAGEGAVAAAILVSRLRTLCSVSSKRTTVPLQLTCSRGSHGQRGEAEREQR